MSVKASSWAWGLDIKPTDKLVLLAIADCANDSGYAYPGYSTLLQKTGLSRQALANAIQRLSDAKILAKKAHAEIGKGRKVNTYQLDYLWEPAQDKTETKSLSRRLTDVSPCLSRKVYLVDKSENVNPSKSLSRRPKSLRGRHEPSYEPSVNNMCTTDVSEKQPIKPAKKVNKTVSFRAWPKPPPEDWWAEILVFRKAKRLSNTQRG